MSIEKLPKLDATRQLWNTSNRLCSLNEVIKTQFWKQSFFFTLKLLIMRPNRLKIWLEFWKTFGFMAPGIKILARGWKAAVSHLCLMCPPFKYICMEERLCSKKETHQGFCAAGLVPGRQDAEKWQAEWRDLYFDASYWRCHLLSAKWTK